MPEMPYFFNLPPWEELPDFGLYMDQMLLFARRYLPAEMTAGMINSYVKAGLIERPQGKKYSRAALAQLLMIGLLKQVMPLESLRLLLHSGNMKETQEVYEQCFGFRYTMSSVLVQQEDLTALDCALCAAEYQAMSRQMLLEQAPPDDKKR